MFSKSNYILLKELIKTDYKLRYQGSFLGHFWEFLKALIQISVRYIVFVHFLSLGKGVTHFSLALFLGMVIWLFFQEATKKSISSLLSCKGMITKTKVESRMIVVAAVFGSVINLGINMFTVALFILFSKLPITWNWLYLFPLFIELLVLTLGISFLLATAYVYFRDIKPLWEMILQILIYAIPIIYPMTTIMAYNQKVAVFLMLNPITQIIQDARHIMIGSDNVTVFNMISSPFLAIVPYILPFLLFAVGFFVFSKYSKKFPEIL